MPRQDKGVQTTKTLMAGTSPAKTASVKPKIIVR
jgi:hypothetical protein